MNKQLIRTRVFRYFVEKMYSTCMYIGAIVVLPIVILIRVIAPICRIRFGYFIADRIGHFAFDLEYYLSKNKRDEKFSNVHDYFFLEGRSANSQLEKICKSHVRVNQLVRLFYLANRMLPARSKSEVLPARISCESRDKVGLFRKVPCQIQLLNSELDRGWKILETLGLQRGDRFVCLMVRDSAYLDKTFSNKDWEYHDFRDSDIRTYHRAITELAEKGYWVFRMGKNVKNPLDLKQDKVVDYANLPIRSDFLDVWLMTNCHFAISTGTGLDSVSDMFRRPVLYLNYDGLPLMVTWAKSLTFPKRLVWRDSSIELTMKEQFRRLYRHSGEYSQSGIEVVDMTEVEIYEAVLEMISFIDHKYKDSYQDNDLYNEFWRAYENQSTYKRYHGDRHPDARIGRGYLVGCRPQFFQ